MADRDEYWQRAARGPDWDRWATIGAPRVPSSWADLLRRDPLLRTAQVVVDLAYAGGDRATLGRRAGRWTAARDGRTVDVRPGLVDEPDLVDQMEVGEPGPRAHSVAVTVDGAVVRAADVVAARRPMTGSAEVALVADGIDWDDRLVHVRGPMGALSFGAPGEPVGLTVRDPAIGLGQVPPWVLDEDRWPGISDLESEIGTRCPLILGSSRLGYCPRVRWSGSGFAEVFLVGAGTLEVSDVVLNGTLQVLTTDYDVLHTVDGLGLPVTVLRFTAASGANSVDDQVYATARETTPGLVSLPVAVQRLLQHGGVADDLVHRRLFGEAAARLGDAGIGTTGASALRGDPVVVIHEAASVLDYLGGTLLDEHPYASLVWEGGRVGLVVVDHRAEPVMRLAAGTHPAIGRARGARYQWSASSELRTSFLARYQWAPVRAQYQAQTRRTPRTSAVCAAAAQALGFEQPDGERQLATTYNAAAADFLLDWLVEHMARASIDVTIDVYPEAWLRLRPGDPVRWTDADVGLSDEPALVVGRRWRSASGVDGEAPQLDLRIYPRAIDAPGSS